MKRILLTLAAAVLLLNTLAIPTLVWADGGASGTTCGARMCKP